LWDERTGDLKVAALTLLDRLIVAVHRAGAGPILVVAPRQPTGLRRTEALGIKVARLAELPPGEGPCLVASTELLVQAVDLRILLERGGRLAASDGTCLPVGVLPAVDGAWRTALEALPVRSATGVACQVRDPAGARAAQRALWGSLWSSTDGLVDRHFNRPCGRPLSRLLVHTPVSPNAVSIASIALGLAAGGLFAYGSHPAAILAALVFQLSAIVDCVDGELARVLFKESPLGRWLDLAGDQVVHLGVFAGIAIGLIRTGQEPNGLWLGLAAVVGALLSFAVVLRGMRRPPELRSGRLQQLIDSATNRDFSVLVLVLACLDRLQWFLWMAALGSQLFWMAGLFLQSRSSPAEGRRP
jgi:phosphatidylglycerophosphate synthase